MRAIDAEFLSGQRSWSLNTFGPGTRTGGLIEHITKELTEIAEEPFDIDEWADVIILALDGAWRHGAEPQEIIDTIISKMERNQARKWPDWRDSNEDTAIEHVR